MVGETHLSPVPHLTDVAISSSFSLVILFICCVYYRFSVLTELKKINDQMSFEQKNAFVFSTVVLAIILFVAVIGALTMSVFLAVHQLAGEKRRAQLMARALKARRLRYAKDSPSGKGNEMVLAGTEVVPAKLPLKMDFHVFLSHTWLQGQDQMRVVKQRLQEMMPDLAVFLE